MQERVCENTKFIEQSCKGSPAKSPNMSVQKYDDDEVIVETTDDDAGLKVIEDVGKVPVTFDNEPKVPLEGTKYELVLELTGRGTGNTRLGADIVMVLDVSGSMGGDKLMELKQAMQFVIRKLSPSDRLSIITFSICAERKCVLRQMTPDAQEKVDFMVQNLKADGGTDISAGLEMALQVLDDRKFTSGRSSAIMLMSDGDENQGRDAQTIAVDRYPIFTFGFGTGKDYKPEVLKTIAEKSKGGTFSAVQSGNLITAFAGCLGGLLSVLVQDVKLKITPIQDKVNKKEKVKTQINKVYAGNYLQVPDEDEPDVVTVIFGNLYQKEKRTVLIDLFLPQVSEEVDNDALEIDCTYSTGVLDEAPIQTNTVGFRVRRLKNATIIMQSDATKAEIKRVEIVELMKKARTLADDNKLGEALNLAMQGRNSLDDLQLENPNLVIETLKIELDEMVKFFQNKEFYDKIGRPYTCSSETSHDRQRFAARGRNAGNILCYATPRQKTCVDQAAEFKKDPSQPVPSVAEDEKKEFQADPLGSIAPSIDHYLKIAIEALKSIQRIINQKP